MALPSVITSTLLGAADLVTPFLAQGGPGDLGRPPVAGEALPPTVNGLGGGVDGAGELVRPAGGGDFTFFYILLAILGGMILLSIMGSRKERKRREAMLAGVRKHDKVQTIGGIIGSVVEVKPDTVVVKVDEASNTRLTFARSAIQQVLKESPEPRQSEDPA